MCFNESPLKVMKNKIHNIRKFHNNKVIFDVKENTELYNFFFENFFFIIDTDSKLPS